MSEKIKLFAFILLIFNQSCFSQTKNKKAETLISIEFSSVTRGTQKTVSVDKSNIHHVQAGMSPIDNTYKTSKNDWRDFNDIVKKLPLSKLHLLKVPSKKHQGDGAMASQLKIVTTQKTYESVTFDNHDAPNELAPLMKMLISKAKLNQ